MKIAVFGLGYVGVVSAACLSEQGHEVTGVEIDPAKVDAVNAGRSPIVEPEVDRLIADGVRAGRIRATADWALAVRDTEMAWVCVGSPSLPGGGVDLTHLLEVCRQIGAAMAGRRSPYLVVIRSTVLPGTTRNLLVPAIMAGSGGPLQEGWGICYHPEFLREGSSVEDFHRPALTIIGSSDAESGDRLATLYAAAPVRCSIEEAEMVKYASNAWHGMKVAFANEIGTVSRGAGLDGRRVMEIFRLDRKLNISEAYLSPGFAFGGSCLPKDLRALAGLGQRLGLQLPLLEGVIESNARHLDRAVELIAASGRRRIGLLGLSFKSGTDDVRESPLLELAVRLLDRGCQLRIYDPGVDLSRVTGANCRYLESRLPGAAALVTGSLQELVHGAELVVLGHLDPSERGLLGDLLGGRMLLDLGGSREVEALGGDYRGICW